MDRDTETNDLEQVGAVALTFLLAAAVTCAAIASVVMLLGEDLSLAWLIGIPGGVFLGTIAASSKTIRKLFVSAMQWLGAL